MANELHLALLKQGVEIWNKWRKENPDIKPNLRGADFRQKDLSGANFSGVYIQGTNFTNTLLKNAEFKGAKAGLTWSVATGLLIGLFFLSALLGFLFLFCGALLGYFFTPEAIEKNTIVPGLFAVALFIILVGSVTRLGLKPDLVGVIIGGTVILTALGWVLAIANLPWALARDEAPALTIPGTALVVGAAAEAFTLVAATIVDGKIWGGQKACFFSLAGALVGIFVGLQTPTIETAIDMARAGNLPIATVNIYVKCAIIIWVLATLSVSIYLARSTLASPNENALIFKGAVTFAATGGTSFRGADLTEADFTQATLKSTDFREAILLGTCWKEAREIDLIRPGNTYLQYEEIRDLLVTGKGGGKHFDRLLNLQGINLKNANLISSSFIDSDLSQANLERAKLADADLKATTLNQANLQEADLSRAKLVQTQLDKSDLSGATLTGAYIEDWGITAETKLERVKCKYVFLRLPTADNPDPWRKPDNWKEDFQEGDFADFIRPLQRTLDLYHNQPVNLGAFSLAFNQLAENYPEAKPSIIAMEVRGENNDKLLVKAQTSKVADHSELSQQYYEYYNKYKSLPQQTLICLIEEKDKQIRMLTGQVETMAEKPTFDLRGSQFGGGLAGRDYTGDVTHNYEQQGNLAEAAAEIQQLLEQLSKTYPTKTTAEQMVVAAEAIKRIESDPTWKQRVINAAKEGGLAALEKALDNPVGALITGAIKGWLEAKAE
jgi:uncharacterized protein YjbI with pentapeptide repeats